ncbi:hypothetical protein C8A05DRAFT_46174 [Staphylotrichum tortipilum]|uniref:Replication protein A subunit n=1 Tax=Staphylotrichum tortipilum TaxID=2831512 RepID=A0AAN6MGS0_9PEZI|nr:hypothetical protein C8A05DRAFT_46174 [Staphylotrichum longicolle]
MAEQQITQGAIEAIFSDAERAAIQFPVPVMQCLHIKNLENKAVGGGGPERYRIVLSDIRNYVQCMLATQANHVMHDGLLQRGSIVRVKQYQAQCLKGKNVMIVLDLEVITALGAPEKIGDPKGMESAGEVAAQNTTIGGAGFYGVKSEPPQESKPAPPQRQMGAGSRAGAFGGGGGGGGSSRLASTIYPIEALSPYANKWTIKVRVTSKSDIRTWHKASGDGKLFSVNFLDETGEIRATAFNQEVDKFYDLLQEGSVYHISTPCRVQIAKKQFSNLNNEYEMVFESQTTIEKAEDQSSVPQVRFNFCNIQELQEVDKDATVDVVGVLKEVNDVDEITSKNTGKPYAKRELTLVDDTGYQVRVTVWGKTATEFDARPESVVAFKGMRVSDFGGRSLSLLSSGTMAVDPDIPEAHKLKGWYDSTGRDNSFATHSNMASVGAASGRKDELKTIGQVKADNLGFENPDYFTIKATILHIRQENFAYPACLSLTCNKKVTDMADGTWRCEKCLINHDRPEYRYILSADVSDHTGHIWVSCFDEQARAIVGRTADEMMKLQGQADGSFEAAWDEALCRKMEFNCRAKMDTFGDQQRVRYQVMSARPMDYKRIPPNLAPATLAHLVAPNTESPHMDQLASMLLEFPPAGGFADDEQYNRAAKLHSQNLNKPSVSQHLRDAAVHLVEHVDPAANSLSHLALLVALGNTNSLPQADLLAKISVFLVTFDARQIRYAGKSFSTILDWLVGGDLFPASVAVSLLTTALLRLDPTGSVLTSHHVALAKLAFTTDNVEAALPLLEKNIVFYPTTKTVHDPRPLCGADLTPAAYITISHGFTTPLTSTDVLQYDLFRGLAFIQRRAWQHALDALERVITYPTRDLYSCSKIMVEAYNKWILVGLLLSGKTPTLPLTTAPGAQKAFSTLCKSYQALGKAFEEGTADAFKTEYETLGAAFFSEENNLGLVRLVLQHYQRWQILNLRRVFSKISLEQIRARTRSAETGDPLASVGEVETLVAGMIGEGMLGGVIERPADGGEAYLSFHAAEGEGLSEAEFAGRMARTAQRLRALEPLVGATNERLGANREYVRFLAERQKKEKEGRKEYELSFLNQVEDEDLMTGVVAGY